MSCRYHFGLFQHLPSLLQAANDAVHDDCQPLDFYCYSSGCISLALAFCNESSVTDVFRIGRQIQVDYRRGSLSHRHLARRFAEDTLLSRNESDTCWPVDRLNILVTTLNGQVEAQTAQNRSQLVDLLVRTPSIPWVTGQHEEGYLDGDFSRTLHPPCARDVVVSLTWSTFIHALNPGLTESQVMNLWSMGRSAPRGPPARTIM